MDLALYLHPFDLRALRDRGGLARLRDLGFGEVSIATSYHDGRWLTPWNPQRRVRFLEDGCVQCPWHGYRFDVRTGRQVGEGRLRLAPAPRVEIDPDDGTVRVEPS